ncbi:hypothetical protein CSKR_103774 [Clonorchis sinensis]|uniref:Uncharacterized protein n=1 Tax=Clonorchis sinensis TaxID=79923 RepID=A0A3R7FVN0_CLOSI|nr:hypothetical protein CSKR_103774 [Clonorchis sinensis]
MEDVSIEASHRSNHSRKLDRRTDTWFGQKVRSSNPAFVPRLLLSGLGQPGSIPALMLPSGGMTVGHRKDNRSAVTPFRCLATMPPKGNTGAGILPGCPNLYRGSLDAEVGFEPRTFREPSRPCITAQPRLPIREVRRARGLNREVRHPLFVRRLLETSSCAYTHKSKATKTYCINKLWGYSLLNTCQAQQTGQRSQMRLGNSEVSKLQVACMCDGLISHSNGSNWAFSVIFRCISAFHAIAMPAVCSLHGPERQREAFPDERMISMHTRAQRVAVVSY